MFCITVNLRPKFDQSSVRIFISKIQYWILIFSFFSNVFIINPVCNKLIYLIKPIEKKIYTFEFKYTYIKHDSYNVGKEFTDKKIKKMMKFLVIDTTHT